MPKRHKFNLSSQINLTTEMGIITPLGWEEVLPGDVFNHKISAFLRCSPTELPIMHPTHAEIRTFFVPNRLIFDGWEEFITGGDVTWPHINFDKVDKGQLPDYLGLPAGTYTQSGISINALPFRAYNLIYNEWFRDDQLGAPAVISNDAGTDSTTETNLRLASWRKDRFTSARTSPQVGDAVTIPIDVNIGADVDYTEPTITADGPLGLGSDDTTNYLMKNSAETGDARWQNGTDPTFQQARYNEGLANTGGAVDVTLTGEDGVDITVEALRRSLALQRFGERLNRHGNRYTEYLRSMGVRSSDARLDRPEYLGGGRQTIQWDEVLQTTPATDANVPGVGNYKGHGIGAMRSSRYVRHFNEHGILMSLLVIRPITMYVNGAKRGFFRDTFDQYFQPELQHLGMQGVYVGEVDMLNSADHRTIFGYQDAYDEYRHSPSFVAGDMNDTLKAFHFGREFAAEPSLNQTFVLCAPRTDPFQIQTTDQFFGMIKHDLRARRLLRRSGTPLTM